MFFMIFKNYTQPQNVSEVAFITTVTYLGDSYNIVTPS